jgi:hypothetical protein
MDPLAAPQLPTQGSAIDLVGWARVALAGEGAASARAATEAEIARVLWRTMWAAAAGERERELAARAWFNDVALGRVVLPGQLVLLTRADGRAAGGAGGDVDRRSAARRDDLDAATVVWEEFADEERVETNGAYEAPVVNALRPFDTGRGSFERGASERGAFERAENQRRDARARGGAQRFDGLVQRLLELAERPRARLLFTRRARWAHPAVRGAAAGVVGPPLVRAWINTAAFADAHSPSEGRSFDWPALRAATERATRMLDGLLDVFDEDPTWRRIGLGIAGLGDALERIGVAYGSDEACVLARRAANAIAEQSHRTSVQLAEERGVFERFADTRWARLGRPRRHALCTLSWPSDGLHAACGLSEGIAWHGVEDDGAHDNGFGGAFENGAGAPSIAAQVKLAVECQRAFEGVVAAQIVAPDAASNGASNGAFHGVTGGAFDARALAEALADVDVQCFAIERPRRSELYPARHEAQPVRGQNGRADGVREVPHDAARETWSEEPRGGAAARFELEVLPARRVRAVAPRGVWVFDVVFDARGERERELLLVSAPPGSDAWRFVESVNAELARVGLAGALSKLAGALASGSASHELAQVLGEFRVARGLTRTVSDT